MEVKKKIAFLESEFYPYFPFNHAKTLGIGMHRKTMDWQEKKLTSLLLHAILHKNMNTILISSTGMLSGFD